MIKKFKDEDMMSILEEGIMECGVSSLGNEALLELAQQRELDDSYSYWVDGELAGCAGLTLFWPGVGDLWMLVGDRAKLNPHETVKSIKLYMTKIIKDNNLWRVQTTGRTDEPDARKLIKILGFKEDCLMEKYGPDKSDYYLYSVVI